MSDFLMIGGTRVPIAAPSGADEEYQELGGEVVRSFSGRLLSTVKGRARVWRLQTPPLPDSEAQMLAAVLAHGSPLLCSGALIGSDAVSCYARGVRTRPVAPLSRLRRVVEFELHEAAPAMSPILFRLHAGQPLPPGASFTRASSAWYFDRDGILREAGPDVLRTEWLDLDGDGVRETPALKLERGTTNKVVRTIGYGSTGTANWTLHASSPAEATLTAVDDAAELARAGLSGIVPDGHVLKLDNSGGATDARVDSTATATGNTVPHTLSAYVRGSGQMRLRLTGMVTPEPAWVDAPTIYTRIVSTQTPNADSSLFSVRARPGAIVYFVLAQMEEGAAASSVVPNPTASAISRDTDEVSLAHSAGLVTMALYTRHVERGTVLLSGFPRLWQLGEGNAGTIRVTASGTYRVTLQPTSGSAVGAPLSTAPDLDQVVELLTLIEVADGEVRGRIFQSLDGGPVEDSGWSSTIAADFDPQTLYLGAASGGQSAGLAAFRDLVVLRGSGWTMDAARRLVR